MNFLQPLDALSWDKWLHGIMCRTRQVEHVTLDWIGTMPRFRKDSFSRRTFSNLRTLEIRGVRDADHYYSIVPFDLDLNRNHLPELTRLDCVEIEQTKVSPQVVPQFQEMSIEEHDQKFGSTKTAVSTPTRNFRFELIDCKANQNHGLCYDGLHEAQIIFNHHRVDRHVIAIVGSYKILRTLELLSQDRPYKRSRKLMRFGCYE